MFFLKKLFKDNVLHNNEYPSNFFKYIGTAGSRYSMMEQIRSTGGMWFSYGGINGVIDPGPGSIYNICHANPVLNPQNVDVILLSHKHLDHSAELNVIAEAMTNGGHQKCGSIILPEDCINAPDPTLHGYIRNSIENIVTMKDGGKITLTGGVEIEAVELLHHGVECFGFIFRKPKLKTWGIIADTKPLDRLATRYRDCEFLSVNATFPNKISRLDHMSFEDVGDLLQKISPRVVTITHLGRNILAGNPNELGHKLCTDKTKVVTGSDGLYINLDTLDIFSPYKHSLVLTGYSKLES